METNTNQEVFRLSRLALALDGGLALGAALAIIGSYEYLGLSGAFKEILLALLPLVCWVAFKVVRWSKQSWTVTADRRLISRTGFLSRSNQVIHLCSVRDAHFHSSLPFGWLGIGNLAFRATGQDGRQHLFSWTWVSNGHRLYEIIQARGDLPLTRRPERRPAFARVWSQMETGYSRLVAVPRQKKPYRFKPGQKWRVADYRQFLAFCQMLFRNRTHIKPCPDSVPLAVERRWIFVLQQARILVSARSQTGWQLAPAIHSLADIRRRIDRAGLELALRRTLAKS